MTGVNDSWQITLLSVCATVMIILLMGVCGSGKTTIGSLLSKQLNCSFADADDFHTEENKMKMSQGIPLTDEDRYPWLMSIHQHIKRLHHSEEPGVITCSALKRKYRDILCQGSVGGNPFLPSQGTANLSTLPGTESSPARSSQAAQPLKLKSSTEQKPAVCELSNLSDKDDTNLRLPVKFIHLNGSKTVLQKRMEHRLGHFMPPELLESQLKTLEPLQEDEDHLVIDVDNTVEDIVANIVMNLELHVKANK